MTSIADIARRSGVSTRSVTLVLDGSKRVRQATRERVLQAVVELQAATDIPEFDGPVPRSGTIGLIVGHVESPFFHQIIGSIGNATYSSKRRLVLCNSDEDPERERFHLSELAAQGVDGIIIVPVLTGAAEKIAPFAQAMPIVCLDRRVPGLELDLAILDNQLGSELAVRHFAGLGHRRIALIATPRESLLTERIAGYQSALAALGLTFRPDYVRYGDLRQNTGYEQMLHLLHLPEPPTAVLVASHFMTLGAMLAIRDRGLRVPQDISLIGFDDTAWSRLLDPALTTIAQPVDELGRAAAHMLIDRLDRTYCGAPREIMLPPSLILRASTSSPALERVA